jgi:hypothetical protein
VKQKHSPVTPAVTAVEELGSIKEIIVLNLVLAVFSRDSKIIEHSPLRTKQPYLDLIQRAIEGIVQDLTLLKNHLKQRGIKITDERRDKSGVGCVYWCRGYKASFEMLWHLAKAETEVRMRKYLGEDIHKYVRTDLPPHLRPGWLLEPVPHLPNTSAPQPRTSIEDTI